MLKIDIIDFGVEEGYVMTWSGNSNIR